MQKTDVKYQAYVQILKEELVPAMGCTEPIALAYAAAKAREVLGCIPDKVEIGASGSIIKNVKSVIVPNTDHLKGIPAAATAGIIAGDASKELEVIANVAPGKTAEMKEFLEKTPITVEYVDNGFVFEIIVKVSKGDSYAKVRGLKAAKKAMIEAMKNDIEGRFAGKEMHMQIAYTCSEEEAMQWKAEVEEKFPGIAIHADRLSLSVSCHIGPGAIAIACCKKIEV